jgi:deoxycytidylate deaminase
MKEKFIRKFMLLAKTIAEDNHVCYSRQIGAVIVDPKTNGVVSIGYNGPPEGTPHTDHSDYIRHFLWPQLTAQEKYALIAVHWHELSLEGKQILESLCDENEVRDVPRVHAVMHDYLPFVCRKLRECKTCPRKLLNCKSGERTELCSCQHAERNALNKLPISSCGLIMFCWCGVPCIQCAGSIINASIKEVHCLLDVDYHAVSRYLFATSNTALFEYEKEKFLDD